ncbi:MAG TPA: amidase family protein [Verrucomicrobiae bacterium]|nr:amidase family protein [Verrucomicrobiae bacterium]
MAADSQLTSLTAQEAVRLLAERKVSPLELVEASAARIAATDKAVNAMPTLCLDRARDHAKRIMAGKAPEVSPWLAGLPIAVKDLNDVAGVRTTYGSPIFADHVPERSDLMVERLEERGCITMGKSNTPEFGAGANTFNEVFGETLNPWNTRLTCAGSSGGAAVALATGQVWLATGSDLGGSLRTPASYCSVVGLRPSPGRVANGPNERPFGTLSVEGPMGRTVGDTALLLDAMAGWHIEDPLSLESPRESFQAAAAAKRRPKRVGFSPDLGIVPVDAEVREICAAAARRFQDLGAAVEEACPDFTGAIDSFKTLRAAGFVAGYAALYETRRDKLKPDVIWNIEHGLKVTAGDIARAELARGTLYHRIVQFFQTHDLLLCPVAPVAPFDVKTRWIREINGVVFDNYVEWLRLAYAITLTSCPAISVPCGFTRDGRPIGLQMVGKPRGEAALLSAAAAFEEMTGLAKQLPIDPRAGRPA